MKSLQKTGCLVLAFILVLATLPGALPAVRAMETGAPGQVIHGEYVVISNGSLDYASAQQTGALPAGNAAPASDLPVGKGAEPYATPLAEGGQSPALQTAAAGKAAAKAYRIGDRLNNLYNGQSYICIGEGAHSYIWMEETLKAGYDAAGLTAQAAAEAAYTYDGRPYQVLTEMSGGIPYMDNSGKLSILLEEMTSTGFYAGESGITAIHAKAPAAGAFRTGAFSSLDGLFVHEGQHALFNLLTCKGDRSLAHTMSWLNEGLSVAAMDYLWGGTDPSGWLDLIDGNTSLRNGSALFYQDYRGSSAQDYSMPYLFVRYLANQAEKGYNPMPFFQSIYTVDATGKTVEQFLAEVLRMNGLSGTVKQTLQNFFVAVVAQEKTGVYGFYGDPVVWEKVKEFPVYASIDGSGTRIPGTGFIVVKPQGGAFTVPSGGGADITYTAVTPSKDILKPAVGSGTAEDPYRIAALSDLYALRAYPSAAFRLENNLDLSDTVYLSADQFTGTLDGGNHTIANLSQPLVITNSGVIQNLNLHLAFREDYRDYAGGFASINNGSILDCYAGGTADGRMIGTRFFLHQTFGPIAGENTGLISGCYSDASVSLTLPPNHADIGGLVGENSGLIKNSYSAADVRVTQTNNGAYEVNAGGLAGRLARPMMIGAYLVQYAYSSADIAMAADGDLLQKNAGRFVGKVESDVAAGSVVSGYALAGMDAAGNANAAVTAGMLRTDAQLKQQSTFTGWSFGSIWKMPASAYPALVDSEELENVTVTTPPPACYVGEKLSLYNAVLSVNGAPVAMTQAMLQGFDSSTSGTKRVTGSYRGKPFAFEVLVMEPVNVTNLVMYQEPKLSYITGESFDPAGAVFTATIDGTPYHYIYSGFTADKTGPLTAGDTTVTFSYGGARLTKNLTVKAKAPAGLSVISPPVKTGYNAGDSLDLTGMLLQITYDDGSVSELFGASKLDEYGIRFAKFQGGVLSPFDLSAPASTGDNGSSIFAFAGEISEDNPANRRVFDLVVNSRIAMEDQTLLFAVNRDNFEFSSPVTGGSGSYSITLIQGVLPSGLTAGNNGNALYFSGRPKTLGDTVLVYEVKDVLLGQTIKVAITLSVVPVSSEADFKSFQFPKAFNPSLPGDIDGVIGADTVTLYVPAGTDVTGLQILHTESRGATLDSSQWNGAKLDFSSPVRFLITAQDGVTTKTYTVSVVVLPKSPVSITVVPPAKTSYTEGQPLDTAGMTVTAHYNDGTSEPVTGYTVAGYDAAPGTKTVIVSYCGKTASFQVTVARKELAGIKITKKPNKTTYIQGQALDTAGMELTLTYNDGTTATIRSGWVEQHDFSVAGQSPVTITYGGKTAVLTVTVTAKALTAISATPPNKQTYWLDEPLDLTGLTVTASYNNGQTAVVTGWICRYDFSAAGKRTVTVEYQGKTASFQVTVNSRVPSKITSQVVSAGDRWIGKIKPIMTAAQLVASLNEHAYVKLFRDGQAVAADTPAGTGMEARLMDGATVKQRLSVVVTGDTNGDGQITISDMLSVKAVLLKKGTLTGAYEKAGDTNGDGKISITDFLQIKSHLLKKESIEPKGY